MVFKYNGFQYVWNKEDLGFNIITCDKHLLPKTLFKYYALNENSVDAMTKLYLYASHPKQLNDPYDCDEEIVNIDCDEDAKILLGPLYSEIKKKFKKDFYKFCNKAFSTLTYKKYGIFSLTAHRDDNDVLWARYANYNGFCIEFDYSKFPFKYYGPFPINYVEELTKVDTSKFGIPVAMMVQTNIKKGLWEHENEFRMIIHNPEGLDFVTFGENAAKYNSPEDHNRKMRYPLCAIKGVTLGQNFFTEEEDVAPVSKFEFDIIIRNNLKRRLIDFLIKISESNNIYAQPIPVYVSVKNGFNRSKYRICIIKLSGYSYRIIQFEK